MGFANGYRGAINGSVQTAYTDQPGMAVDGMEAFASDQNAADACVIGQIGGIAAGRGVKLAHQIEAATNLQHPNVAAFLPVGDEGANEFGGIVLFDENMQSNEKGIPGWDKGRMARIGRPVRSGSRVWVKVPEEVVLRTATVNWVISAPTVGALAGVVELGQFVPTALPGGTGGVSVALTNLVWVVPAAAGGLAMLEMVGVVTASIPINSSSN